MMKIIVMFLMAIALVSLVGCDSEVVKYVEVDNPPAIPQGVYSITGDEFIFVEWLPVQDDDLLFYRVWWSEDDVTFTVMDTVTVPYYFDYDVTNGESYFYAVTAVDEAYNESGLSLESVLDTPRPEGYDVLIADFIEYPGYSGFDLSEASIVRYDNAAADFYVEYDDILDIYYIHSANIDTDIQDMGYQLDTTDFFSEIGYAPIEGWSETGKLEVVPGHVYVIWTADNHFAKIRPFATLGADGMKFDWAYQTDVGNPELSRPQNEDADIRTKDGSILK
ncbi:MAG: hypothetical protein ABIJ45_11405 [Candidatus Zixiibacteriota bacterium]